MIERPPTFNECAVEFLREGLESEEVEEVEEGDEAA